MLIPPILILLFLDQREAVIALFLVASLGDVLDGMVARRRREVSTLGKALDPAVDKLLYVSLLSSLTALGDIPIHATLLFALPHVGLAFGAIFIKLRSQIIQGARALGKSSSIITFLAVVLILARLPYASYVLYAAIATAYMAGVDYLLSALKAIGSKRSHIQETPRE